MSPRTRSVTGGRRPGTSLIELLIAMVILSVLGAAMIRTMIRSNTYIDRLESGREARSTARGGLNLLSSELRMVAAGDAIEALTATSITVRVPFRLGVTCQSSITAPSVVTAAMFPADTTIATTALGYHGFATLQTVGTYQYTTAAAAPTTGVTSTCTSTPVNLTLASGMSVLTMTGQALPALVPVGTPIMLWRRVRYEFAASTALPGRRALWRRVIDGAGIVTQSDEIAAPLNTSSRFGFLINNQRAPVDTLPSSLGSLRGLELQITGEGLRAARNSAGREQSRVLMSIPFLNRPD